MDALKIAFAILKTVEMDKSVQADEDTYNNIIKSAAYLMPPGDERNRLALVGFDKAKAAGKVTMDTVRTLRKALDNDCMREVLAPLENEMGNIDYRKIPKTWSKNVYK